LSYAIKLDLPNDPAPAAELAPATVKLSVDESGQIFWDTDRVSDAQLTQRFAEAAARTTTPEVHLRADKATRYERIAFVMSAAQQAGLTKIGFITEPAPGTATSAPPIPATSK
ncbi:MAG TPA: biopolymer transporter ExbD, partial [Pseudomonadales bacterium]